MRIHLAIAAIVFSASQAIAGDGLYSMWCSDESGEIGLNRRTVEMVDHSCKVSGKVRIGRTLHLQCSGDSGAFEAQWLLSLSGDTLTVTEDGAATVYKRCK